MTTFVVCYTIRDIPRRERFIFIRNALDVYKHYQGAALYMLTVKDGTEHGEILGL